MTSPDEFDRQFIENNLLPHLRKYGSSQAFKDYDTFVNHSGISYKKGDDLQAYINLPYWQTWQGGAAKNFPKYEVPMHLVRDQEAYDKRFIENNLLPHLRKYTSGTAFKDYDTFITHPGISYKPGADLQAYMNLPYWQTWQGGAAKNFPKYGVPDTCNPFMVTMKNSNVFRL